MAKKRNEKIIYGLMWVVTYFIVFIVGFIVLDIIIKGFPAIIKPGFLSDFPSRGGSEGGILPAIIGTLYLILGAIIIALPFGIAAAIYLNEYAKKNKFTYYTRLAISTLAGVPSIVFGLFGLGLFVLFMGLRTSIIAGSLTLACMILPTIIVSSEESLKTVPMSMREGALALGATKWQTIYKNVLPYALPGMITGSIIGIGRAAGETAPIIFTVAAFYLPKLPHSLFDQVMALPSHLYYVSTQIPASIEKIRPIQYGTALTLLILVLGVNLIAIILRGRLRRKYRW